MTTPDPRFEARSIPASINYEQMRRGRPPVYGTGVQAPEISHEPETPPLPSQPSYLSRTRSAAVNRLSREPSKVNPSWASGWPSILRRRSFITGAWGIAIILVAFDEWKYYGVFPRPKRLFDTSMVYLGLMGLSVIDAFVPLANALAAGYTLTLLWQYYNGGGQFSRGGTGTAGNSSSNSSGILPPLNINTNQFSPGALAGSVTPGQVIAPGVVRSNQTFTRPGMLPTESRL